MMQMGSKALSNSQPKWLIEYLKTLCLKRFTASAAKRAAIAGTEFVLVSLFVPSALTSSVMYLTTSAVGSAGKNLVSYGLNGSGSDGANLMVAIPAEDLPMLEEKLKQDKKWDFSLSSMGKSLKKKVKNKAIGACRSVLNITYRDLSEGTGAFVGSTVATVAFVAYMGPPSLFILPLYFLAEGCTKSVGAFLGRYWGRYFIGPKVLKPAIRGTWAAICGSNEKAIELSYQSVLYELEKVSFEEDDALNECTELLQSWYLFKTVQPKPSAPPLALIKLHDVEIIEDYDPGPKKTY